MIDMLTLAEHCSAPWAFGDTSAEGSAHVYVPWADVLEVAGYSYAAPPLAGISGCNRPPLCLGDEGSAL